MKVVVSISLRVESPAQAQCGGLVLDIPNLIHRGHCAGTARSRFIKLFQNPFASLHQFGQIDTCFDPGLMEHTHETFTSDVPLCSRCKWTPTKATHAAVEHADSGSIRFADICRCLAVCIMEVASKIGK